GVDLVGPLASGGTAVIAEAGGGAVAPLAAGCPGTINFDNTAGTSLWGTAANWDLDRLPNASDDVCIGPGLAVQSAGTQAAGTIFVSATSSLTVTSGTLTFATA